MICSDDGAQQARTLPPFKGQTDSGMPFQAPEGKFRVIGVDTFNSDDWHEGDFDTLDLARSHVTDRTVGKQMLMMYIYNDQGDHVDDGGSF